MGKARNSSKTPLLGAGVGILDLIPRIVKSFHMEAAHTGLSPRACGELRGGYICITVFLGKLATPYGFVIMLKVSPPFLSGAFAAVLEGDPVERDCGPGTAGILNDLSAAQSKVPTP